jgi:hypothetical protein
MSSHNLSFSRRSTRFLAAGIAAIVIGGGAFGIVSAASSGGSSAAATVPATTAASGHPPGFAGASGSGGGGNARSGPAAGGSVGTVSNLSSSGFTLTTSTGQKVTIKETSSTAYEKGTTPSSGSAVFSGETALVLGTTDSTTITATEVILEPPNDGSSSSQVVPFARGASSTSKTVGQIPSSYNQGSGKIVSGTTANQATEAALAAYPGGIVDRVVQLSNGEYEVHYIGVNWPHHIFVSTDFTVVGAD